MESLVGLTPSYVRRMTTVNESTEAILRLSPAARPTTANFSPTGCSWVISPSNGVRSLPTVDPPHTGGMTLITSPFIPQSHPERGAATAEYAIATVAAAGFAGLLAVVLKSNPVQNLLTDLISGALSIVS